MPAAQYTRMGAADSVVETVVDFFEHEVVNAQAKASVMIPIRIFLDAYITSISRNLAVQLL